jgi:glutathione synthase/RimK-type ligase-like ATP-grasp enzyme
VKPTIGASAKGVKRFNEDSKEDVREYAIKLVKSGVDALIQPFAKEIAHGEVSFVFFGDQYSHACKKTPAEGDFRVQLEYGGHDRYFDANPDQIAQAKAVLEATPFDLLYARVDMLEVNGKFVLMELEAIEPYLFFGYNQAPQVFLSVLKDYVRHSCHPTA